MAFPLSSPTRDESRQFPLVLTADIVEDYAPAVALALRQRQQESLRWLPVLLPSGSRLPQLQMRTNSLHSHVGMNELVPTADWVAFQKLWFRWQAPRDHVPPMRWYLTAAWPSSSPPTDLAAVVDQCLQQLAALPPHARADHIRATLQLDKTHGSVIGWGDWQWALPAMLHASLMGKPFLWCESKDELVEAATHESGPLTIAIPLHQLDLDLLNQLVDTRSFHSAIARVQAVHFSERPISFFTARTLEIFSRLPVKHHLYRQAPLEQSAWVLTEQTEEKATDPDVTLLGRQEASVGHLELVEQPDVLVLWGHSREDLFHLGPDALCGISSEAPLTKSNHRLPACIHDGHCVKDGAILPVTRLPAKLLIMAGCNLMRLGGLGSFGPEYTLAFSSLEGSCNLVVASRRTRFGHQVEQIFMYQLIRAGMTVGEAVRLVNNSLPFSGPESPDYLVLGEGDWMPFAPEQSRVQVEITPESNGWHVQCRDIDTYYIEIRLPSFSAEVQVRPLQVAPELEDIFYSIVPEPDNTCRIFLFGWRRLQTEQLSFWIGSDSQLSQQVQALQVAYHNQAYSRLFRSYLPKFENWEKELRSLSTYLARRLKEASYLPMAYREAEEKAIEAEALLSRMDQNICAFLLERIAAGAFVWLDQYMEVDGSFCIGTHLLRDHYCPYCHSPVVRKTILHRFDQQVGREFALCQTCGNIWDIPLAGINPVFQGPEVLTRSAGQKHGVVVKNTLERRVRGWLGFRIYQAQKYGVTVDPPLQELVLAPGEEAEAHFSINISKQMPAHIEFARGFWVSELGVSVFQRNIWVVPGNSTLADGHMEGSGTV